MKTLYLSLLAIALAAPACAKDSPEWTKCYKEQQKLTGSKACFNACKEETGIDEFNIGSAEMKDQWIECQYKKKCNYYDTVARRNCDKKVFDHVLEDDAYMEKLRHNKGIKEENKDKWIPEYEPQTWSSCAKEQRQATGYLECREATHMAKKCQYYLEIASNTCNIKYSKPFMSEDALKNLRKEMGVEEKDKDKWVP